MLPRTNKGKISTEASVLEEYDFVPLFQHYLKYKQADALMNTLKIEVNRIHPRFNTLVSTGRTSSFSPNVQNLDHSIRSIFIPCPGHIFIAADYSQVELRTLAQVCFKRFGSSRMRDLLIDRVDIHSYVASLLTSKPADHVSKEDRQKAKACNFGFPGGLGVKAFIKYAKATYGVELSEEEANKFREKWLDIFPEVRKYLKGDEVRTLCRSGLMTSFSFVTGKDWKPEIAACIFIGIISGKKYSSKRSYTKQEINWAFKLSRQRKFYGAEKFKKRYSWQTGIKTTLPCIYPIIQSRCYSFR